MMSRFQYSSPCFQGKLVHLETQALSGWYCYCPRWSWWMVLLLPVNDVVNKTVKKFLRGLESQFPPLEFLIKAAIKLL